MKNSSCLSKGDRKAGVFLILSATLVLAGLSSGAEFAFGEINFDDYDYRTIDGTGNNEANPEWGSAGIPFIRHSGDDYNDRYEITGEDRKNPRCISNIVASQDGDVFNEKNASDFIWQWGQFLDHDVTLTPVGGAFKPIVGQEFECNEELITFIPFTRSIQVDANDSKQQINEITAFIDASNVYGSDDEITAKLRDGNTMYMRVSDDNLLPEEDGMFIAGDVRANEGIRLIAMHTLFVLEHNRIAEELKQENPNLTDDQIFELARKIVGAKMQVITYNEFLPKLLGPDAISPYSGYDDTTNPGIKNEFSTAAFRYGHSQVSSTLLIIDGKETSNVSLKNNFFNHNLFKEIGMEPIIKGIAHQKAQNIDTLLVDELRNFLFAPSGEIGIDLASLNIERGRDHGLPDYNTVRDAYGLDRVKSFDEISSDPQVVAKLKAAYESVDDIDLWVGGLAEDHYPNAMVGETIRTILVEQFISLRDGDRFWYENDEFFEDNKGWKNKVHKTTLKKVIDDNTSLNDLYPDVFQFKKFDDQ